MTINQAITLLTPKVKRYNAETYGEIANTTTHIIRVAQKGNLYIFGVMILRKDASPNDCTEDDILDYWQVDSVTGAIDIRIF